MTSASPDDATPSPAPWIAGGFLVLTGLLLADPWGAVHPPAPRVARDRNFADPSPVRQPPTKVPRLVKGPYEYSCQECHRHLDTSRPTRGQAQSEHRDIVLEHGRNDRCYNCHHRENRNALVDHDGGEIGYDDVPKLCGKCHGTLYRDWEAGTHGRRGGSWKPESPDRTRLACNACHDPHAPRFGALAPAPPPRHPDRGAGRPTPPQEARAP